MMNAYETRFFWSQSSALRAAIRESNDVNATDAVIELEALALYASTPIIRRRALVAIAEGLRMARNSETYAAATQALESALSKPEAVPQG